MNRLPRSKRSLIAVFVITVLVVIAGSASGPLMAQPDPSVPDHPEYDADTLVPPQVELRGSITGESRTDTGTVVIDFTHQNRISQDDLEPLTSAIREAGWQVEFAERSTNFEAALSRADTLLVIDPGRAYTQREVDRIETFVDDGGRLVMAGEPRQFGTQRAGFFLIIVPQENNLGSLGSAFGISFGESFLFNMASNDGNFKHIFASATGNADVVEGVDQTTMHIATTVQANEGTTLLEASDGTKLDRTDATGDYSVAVQSGNVIAIGDKTFMQRGNYQAADNNVLLGNIVSFLTAADRSRDLRDYPAIVTRNPTIRYTSVGLLDAAQEVTADLKTTRPGQPAVTLDTDRANAGETDVLITTFDYLQRNPGLGTGIDVSDGEVSVPGYESSTTGVYMIHQPESGFDVVIVGDTKDRVKSAADTLTASGGIEDNLISDRTVVVRTDEAEPPEDEEPNQ